MSWFKKEIIKKLVITRPSSDLITPSAEESRGWLGAASGKYHKAELIERLEDLKDNWVNGDYTGATAEATIQMNAEALGKAGAYADMILSLEEMTEDDQEEEQVE